MKTRFFDLPLRFQIAIPFSILIMAVIVLAFGVGLPLAQKSAEEEQDLKLENARSLLQLALANQQDHRAAPSPFWLRARRWPTPSRLATPRAYPAS